MTTDENILIEMLERATNPSRDGADNIAVPMFCMMVKSNIDLVTKAHELIVKKMRSSNTTEAARAIGLLEECMSKAGLEFQKKTAKFTFLNELIALVLDKHDGPPAPIETKKRIMDCLMLWTVQHQDKTKIQEAYDNLTRQVNFDYNSSTASSTTSALTNSRMERSTILGNDDELVAMLLKLGGSENYKRANLLIQHRVNQEARRTEFICHLKSELKKIESTMEVFEEMLNAYTLESTNADNRDIIIELNNTCKKHNEQMARWPDFLGDGEPKLLEDVINTRDHLIVTLQRYKGVFENAEQSSITDSPNKCQTNTDLLSELLGGPVTTSTEVTNPIKTKIPIKDNNTLNELNEIFGSFVDNAEVVQPHHPSTLMNNLDLLESVSVCESKLKDKYATIVEDSSSVIGKEQKKTSFKELKEIDKLSEEMFKQNLKEEQQRLQSFKKDNISKKLTLNDMVKDKVETSLTVAKDMDQLTQNAIKCKQEKKLKTLEDFQANVEDLTRSERVCTEQTKFQDNNEMAEKRCLKDDLHSEVCKPLTYKPLAEIYVDLDEVTPLDEGQRLLLDDDIQVTLYFTADRPSEYVSVIVMSVVNKSKLPVTDFHFEASVKKPCKVRLLPPTDVNMAPRNPFRPALPINQVVLLLNPTQNPVDISCIIGYRLGDDPDPIKELIVTKDIPYV